MKRRKWMLLLQTAAVLALATGLAAPVQAAKVDTTRETSLTIAFAEDDAADVQKSIVADLSCGGVRQFDAELYRVGSYTADGSLITEPDFAELDLENVVAEALAAYEKQQQEAEANPTPTPAATETPAEPTPQPTPDNGHIPGSVWQGVWDEKAAQAVKLIQQNRLEPATTVQINYETCTDTTARYTGTAGNLVCGMYLVRLPALNGAAYRYSAKDYALQCLAGSEHAPDPAGCLGVRSDILPQTGSPQLPQPGSHPNTAPDPGAGRGEYPRHPRHRAVASA